MIFNLFHRARVRSRFQVYLSLLLLRWLLYYSHGRRTSLIAELINQGHSIAIDSKYLTSLYLSCFGVTGFETLAKFLYKMEIIFDKRDEEYFFELQ